MDTLNPETGELTLPTPSSSPIRRSETIAKLATALAKAQGQLGAVKRDQTATVPTKKGGQYSYHYTELSSVIEAIRAIFAKEGLCYVQAPAATIVHVDRGPDGVWPVADVTVTTAIAHSSGEFIESSLTIRAKDDAPQSVGSAITYARRYALLAAVGLAPEDDDGKAAQGDDRPAQAASEPQKPDFVQRRGGKGISAKQAARMFAIAKEAGLDLDELKAYCRGNGWQESTDIPWREYDGLIEKIKAGTLSAPPPEDDFAAAGEIGETVFPDLDGVR